MLEPDILHFDIPGGDRRLACYRWGDAKAARTVICVHGLTRNGRDFDFLAERLAQDYQVLCPDMAGRGQSQWLKDGSLYTNNTYIADVMYMLGKLSLTRVHWVGTSMGGIMGMMAPSVLPGLIDALVLNDVGCLIPASGLARIREIADLPTSYASRAEAETAFRGRCKYFGIEGEAQWRHLLKYGVEERDGRFAFTYDPAIFSAGFSKDTPLTDISLWPLWEAVKPIPTLLIRGAESDILPRETAVEMQARHPDLTLHEIIGVGHAPALMDEKQITLIQDWLRARN